MGVRDGADLVVEGYEFAPTFSIWTTIEECLNPPLIWERERGFYTTRPFSEPEVLTFPEVSARIECASTSSTRRWVLVPTLGGVRAGHLQSTASGRSSSMCPHAAQARARLHRAGHGARAAEVAPRDVVAAALPDPATLRRSHMTGRPARARGCAAPASTGSRARRTCTTWWTTSRRCASTAARRSSGRPRSTRSWHSSCSTRACGRAPACSAPRRSLRPVPRAPSRSWALPHGVLRASNPMTRLPAQLLRRQRARASPVTRRIRRPPTAHVPCLSMTEWPLPRLRELGGSVLGQFCSKQPRRGGSNLARKKITVSEEREAQETSESGWAQAEQHPADPPAHSGQR